MRTPTTLSATSQPPAVPPGIGLRPSLPAGLVPTSVAIGDFNGDGRLDWVVANGGDNTLYLYLGKGDGTAQLPVIIPLAGKSPIAVAVGDLNGDGRLDLVVGESDSQSVGILFGNGDGTFQPEVELPGFPVAVLAVAVADLNRDGHMDLLVGLAGEFQTVAQSRFAVLLNDGTGHFGAPIYAPNIPQLRFPKGQAFSVADVNGDGIPDVLVTGSDDNGGSTQIFLGNGNGTFNAGQVIYVSQIGAVPRLDNNAVLADVNGDGCLDAIVVDTFTEAVIFPGDCKGNFSNTTGVEVYGMGDVGYGLAVADINGDGHVDLIVSGVPLSQNTLFAVGYATGNTIGVRLNDGAGHFGPLRVYRGDPGIFSLAVADLLGNGRPCIITANQDANTTTVYLNDGSGSFGKPSGGYDGEYEGSVNGFFNPPKSQFITADINGDGLPDLALIEASDASTALDQVTVLLNQGNGQFGPPIRTPALDASMTVGDVAFADFRNVGVKDFIGVSFDDTNCAAPKLVYAPNQGSGRFGAATQIPFNVASTCFAFAVLAVGDFNHDNKLDFVIASYTGPSANAFQLTSYLGNGDGTFRQASQMNFGPSRQISSGPYPQAIFVADANGDGKPDIFVWLDDNTFGPGNSGKDLLEFLGNGDGTFRAPRDVLQSLDFMTMRDLNHDGRLDVIQIAPTGQIGLTPATVNIYLGQPDGTFGPPTEYSPFAMPFTDFYGNNVTSGFHGALGPYVGDFNGDSNEDIAIFQASINGLPAFAQFLVGKGDGTFEPAFNVYSLGIRHIPDLVVENLFGDGRAAWLYTPNYPASYVVLPSANAPAFQLSAVETPVVSSKDAVEISLNTPSASPTLVLLSASDPSVQITASATIPAGALSIEVPFTLSSTIAPNHWFAITAEGGGTTVVAYDFAAPSGSADPFSLGVSGGFVPPGMSSTPAPGQSSAWGAFVSATGNASSTFQASCLNLPARVSCVSFSPESFFVPTDATGATGFTVVTDPSMAPGAYPFTVTATDGFVTLTASATLEVGDFTLNLSPLSVTAPPTGTVSFNLSIGALFGYFQNVVITCANLPQGATCPQQGQNFPPSGTESFSIALDHVPSGTYTLTLTGTSNSLVHTATAQFQVVAVPAVSLSASKVSFPPALVGATASQAIQLSNSGTGTLSISNIASSTAAGGSGTFSTNSGCGTSLAPQASCTFTVIFSAVGVGTATGSVSITDNAPDSPQTIGLSASGVDFSLGPASGSSTSAAITAGQTAQFTLQVVPSQFQGNISLICSGAPPAGNCFPSTQTIAVSGSSPAVFQITVTTKSSSGVAPSLELPKAWPMFLLIVFALSFVVGIHTISFAGKFLLSRSRAFGWPNAELLRVLKIIVSVILLLALANCGGGGSGGGGNPGTPSGTYTVTVNGSAAGGSRTIALTVIVK